MDHDQAVEETERTVAAAGDVHNAGRQGDVESKLHGGESGDALQAQQ